jgi:hypothetical protein
MVDWSAERFLLTVRLFLDLSEEVLAVRCEQDTEYMCREEGLLKFVCKNHQRCGECL